MENHGARLTIMVKWIVRISSLDSNSGFKLCSDDNTVNSNKITSNIKVKRKIKQILGLLYTNSYDSSSEQSSTMNSNDSDYMSPMSDAKYNGNGDNNQVYGNNEFKLFHDKNEYFEKRNRI